MRIPFFHKKQDKVSRQDYHRALKSSSLPFVESMTKMIHDSEGDTMRYHRINSHKMKLKAEADHGNPR